MTTWTLDQIAQAERLRAKIEMGDEMIQRGGDVAQEFAADKMAKQLTHMAHPFGIELHREDFEVQWTRNAATPWLVTGEMRWHPTTHEAELRGGHLDGQRVAIQRIGDPLRVHRAATTPWWQDSDTETSAAVTEMTDTYELVGWREDERVWVYATRSSRA